MIQFREGVKFKEKLPEGSYIKPQILSISPELQMRLQEKYPDLKNIQEHYVLKKYSVSEWENSFLSKWKIKDLSDDENLTSMPPEERIERMARILKNRQEFVADYFHDVLPNLVTRSLFIPIIDKSLKPEIYNLYELQNRVDTNFSVQNGFNEIITQPSQVRKRMQSELLAFCKKAKMMHLQDKNSKYKKQVIDIIGDNLFFTRDGELKLVDTNVLPKLSHKMELRLFLQKLSFLELNAEIL